MSTSWIAIVAPLVWATSSSNRLPRRYGKLTIPAMPPPKRFPIPRPKRRRSKPSRPSPLTLGRKPDRTFRMQTRLLGSTGLRLPVLSFGASSLGQEFRRVNLEEAIHSVHVALDHGLNFIDTSPFY